MYTTRVILPAKFWDDAADENELNRAISIYMARLYPHYEIIEIGKYYAICRG